MECNELNGMHVKDVEDVLKYSMRTHSGALKWFSSISAEHTIRILIVVYVITFLINLLYF